MAEADNFLRQIEDTEFADQGDAVAAVIGAVAAINEEISRTVDYEKAGMLGLTGTESGRRIGRYLKRLYDIVKSVAERFGAFSYSIEVGFPKGISVSFSWKGPPP